MRQPKPWTNLSHTLVFPIDIDGGELITEVVLKPFTVEQHRAALVEAGKDEDARYEALLRLASGLPEEHVDLLKRPDYISLQKLLQEYISLPATYFQEIKLEDPDDAPLLIPIKGIGRTIERVTIEPPAVRVTKAMGKLKTDDDRADFISAACTGLPAQVLKGMAIPDWTQLQMRLDDFLNQPASYFQPTTSK